MRSFPHLRQSQRTAPLLLALAVALGLLAGCARPGPPPEAAVTEAVPLPPGLLLSRPDLQHLADRQARRDTAALVAALAHPDPIIRTRAAFGLGSVQAPNAVEALVERLRDPDARVRAEAAFAIGQSADAAATGPLLDALHAEPDPTVRRRLLTALGQTGDRAALGALVSVPLPAALEADRALALARFGLRGVLDPGATAWLAARVTAPDPDLRRNAAYLFGRLPNADPWQDHADALRRASTALATDDPAQAPLALALGRLPGTDPALVRLLTESTDWRVRVNAARALADATPTANAQRALLLALEDPSPHVGIAAAQSLSRADLPGDVLDALVAWMEQHPDRWHTWTAFLPAFGRNGRGELLVESARRARDLSGDDAPFAWAATLSPLAGLDDRAALVLLADAATDQDSRVAYAALEALKSRWQRTRSPEQAPIYYSLFAEATRRADAATAYAAAPVLSDSLFRALGSGVVLREVYTGMAAPRDLEPMVEILRSQGLERDTAAITFLLRVAFEGRHPVLRQTAVEALDTRFGDGIEFAPTGGSAPAFPEFDWPYLRRLGPSPRIVFETTRGTVVLELDTQTAPLTAQVISRLARRGLYDGVPFHRVVPNFVIQGGDFARADGLGGPGFYLPSEFSATSFETGVLGMASAGKDTEGSQFFVMHGPHPHLDGRYTVFGRVVEGQDVVDAILVGDRVLSTRVEDSGR